MEGMDTRTNAIADVNVMLRFMVGQASLAVGTRGASPGGCVIRARRAVQRNRHYAVDAPPVLTLHADFLTFCANPRKFVA
jgi:hypothetical protein